MDVRCGSFVWDGDKEKDNILRHGVDFRAAARAFLDKYRVIARDAKHSKIEERRFCVGRVDEIVLTVRFVRRGGAIRIIGAGNWRKGWKLYAQKKRRGFPRRQARRR